MKNTRLTPQGASSLAFVVTAVVVLLTLTRPSPAGAEFGFLTAWGNEGINYGTLYFPTSVAAGPDGNIFVVDLMNFRILKFDSSGSFITKWGEGGTGNGQFYSPYGLAIDAFGNVYVADYGNDRIQKFDSNGRFLIKWGGLGEDRGLFNGPSGVAIGPNGYVFVTDRNNNRIQRFSSGGNFQRMWGWGVNNGLDEFQTCTYSCQAGIAGSGDGQLEYPFDLAVDQDSNVYVTDFGNNRIQKFYSGGAFQRMWGWGVDDGSDEFQVCTVECQAGIEGSGDGQFDSPYGVATGPDGDVYVVDAYNNRIQSFDSGGGFQLMWGWGVDDGSDEFQICTGSCQAGIEGSGDGQFDNPFGLAADLDGNLYIADTYNNRIQKFDSDERFLVKWGSERAADGLLDNPVGVAIDPSGNVYVADSVNNRIQKFDSGGGFQLMWGWGVRDGSKELQVCTVSCQAGIMGSGNGQFDTPFDLAVDSEGHVYVADTYNDRIQKFDSGGNFLYQWGEYGDGEGDLYEPYGVAVDAGGNVYVADTSNHRIQKFDSSGSFQVMWGWGVLNGSREFQICANSCRKGRYGSGNGEFEKPRGVAVDTGGNVYVADSYNNRIQKFRPDGIGYSYETQWGAYGAGSGQFNYPFGINADASGNIYVADAYNNRIQKFDSGGGFLYQWGQLGAANGRFDSPYGVAADPSGNVYVADTSNHRIQKFGELPLATPPLQPPLP